MIKTLKNLLKQDKERYSVPRKVQDIIPIQRIWKDGIFQVGNRFSKTYKFSDINYLVASREDKEAMFLAYSELLNSLDSGATTKITINNRRLNKANFEQSILMPMRGDSRDVYRKEYNQMLLDKATGANGIIQEKYITISVAKKDIEEARTYFARVGADLISHFAALGSKCTEMHAGEKLRVLHDFYRQGEEAAFHFDPQDMMKKGHDFKDYICPDSIEKNSDYLKLGDKYCRVLFLKDYASYIKDSMVTELTDFNRNMMLSIDVVPVPTDEAVREVENRLLGVETNMWDRLVQQCIKQVMEPICEAKFSENSYGFRPLRSVEHAIQRVYQLMQRANLHYVVEFDIKGFFDNVDHSKLVKQIWSLGIRDKHLLYVIKQILKAPIKMPNGEIQYPSKGTPQGGIISPLLANIVLNELDHWIDSQWIEHPITEKYSYKVNSNGSKDLGHAYRAMKTTGLKEMYIVRYADDFRILCRTKSEAERIKIAVSKWLWERLRLEVSPEKTRIVNVKKKYSEFLGFKIKVHPKGEKWTIESHVCDKALCRQKEVLIEQAKKVASPPPHSTESYEIHIYNAKVVGAQNYYKIATHINIDFNGLHLALLRVFTNRLRTQKCNRLRRKGRPLTKAEIGLYGNTPMMRYVAGSDEPIYPIGFVQHKPPWTKKRKSNFYTAEGRKEIHDNLRINTSLMVQMMKSMGSNSTECISAVPEAPFPLPPTVLFLILVLQSAA